MNFQLLICTSWAVNQPAYTVHVFTSLCSPCT